MPGLVQLLCFVQLDNLLAYNGPLRIIGSWGDEGHLFLLVFSESYAPFLAPPDAQRVPMSLCNTLIGQERLISTFGDCLYKHAS